MGEPMSAEELAATLTRVLAENGVSGNNDGLHGWRCAHPDRYGECSCVAELVDDLVSAIRPSLAEVERLREQVAELTANRPAAAAPEDDEPPEREPKPDPPCPDCGLVPETFGNDWQHAEDCPRSGTCGQCGPPWTLPPFHSDEEMAQSAGTVVDYVRTLTEHHRTQHAEPIAR